MAGRRPKPTKIKQVCGNPGKRPLNAAEPSPEVEIPECPDWLDDLAKEEWIRIAPELHAIGLVARIYRAGLAAYCVCWSRWVHAEKEVQRLGPVIKTKTGYPIQNPFLGIATTALEQMRKYATEFGLTPSSISRTRGVGSGEGGQKEDDPWQEFLNPAKPAAKVH